MCACYLQAMPHEGIFRWPWGAKTLALKLAFVLVIALIRHHHVSSVLVRDPPPPPCPPGQLSCQGSTATGHTYGGAEGARKFFFSFPLPILSTLHPNIILEPNLDSNAHPNPQPTPNPTPKPFP